MTRHLTHLDRLEAEAIHIFREVVATCEKPVLLYSAGKDSAVLLHLALKAFYPSTPPFPLLMIDTTYTFQEMYTYRDRIAARYGLDVIVHQNDEGVAQGINPWDHGSALYTDIMNTQGLKQALSRHQFDAAFGGARRDEEKSRAKERIFSFRTRDHRWDPKNQRPELWSIYNARMAPGESIRAFPMSNWAELDIWQYIYREQIEVAPLYFAKERLTVIRDGEIFLVDDERMPLKSPDEPEMRMVRFRTLGCYPLTAAMVSDASTLELVIEEMMLSRRSEREGRVIDRDGGASMERKKQEGYF